MTAKSTSAFLLASAVCTFTACADPCQQDDCAAGDPYGQSGGSGGSVAPDDEGLDDDGADSEDGESDSAGGGAVFCEDADGDGYGSPQSCDVFSFDAVPDTHVDNADDCDDTQAFAYPGAAENEDDEACMEDNDGDGWGDAAPSGLATVQGSDCDDEEGRAHPGAAQLESPHACMQDRDGDGWGDAAPSGLDTIGGDDCDDTDPSTFPGSAQFDSPHACMKDTDGDGWGESTPREGTTPGSDCDDTLGYAYPGSSPNDDASACMADADGDGYGDDSPSNLSIVAGSDCDDVNPTTHFGAAHADDPDACMNDDDGDGWGDDQPQTEGVQPGQDCNDAAPSTFPGAAEAESATLCMSDADEDGHGDSSPLGGTIPGGDCDDTDTASATDCFANVWCADQDEDGRGDMDTCVNVLEGQVPPVGWAPNPDDCDDADPTTFFGSAPMDDIDACMSDEDEDGYGDANPLSAAAIAGSDCDDTDAFTFPGAAQLDDPTACMTDRDGDGRGAQAVGCQTLGGLSGSDCDDSLAGACRYFVDGDGDGFGHPGTSVVIPELEAAPDGSATNGLDCLDLPDAKVPDGAWSAFAAMVYPSESFESECGCYMDIDRDGYGADALALAGIASLQTGLVDLSRVAVGGDCLDSNVAGKEDIDRLMSRVYPGAAWLEDSEACMADVDGDGWGAELTISVGYPTNLVLGTDCYDELEGVSMHELAYAPGGANIHPGVAWAESVDACMLDGDGDGLGNPTPPPEGMRMGLIVAGVDCDDDDPTTEACG